MLCVASSILRVCSTATWIGVNETLVRGHVWRENMVLECLLVILAAPTPDSEDHHTDDEEDDDDEQAGSQQTPHHHQALTDI